MAKACDFLRLTSTGTHLLCYSGDFARFHVPRAPYRPPASPLRPCALRPAPRALRRLIWATRAPASGVAARATENIGMAAERS